MISEEEIKDFVVTVVDSISCFAEMNFKSDGDRWVASFNIAVNTLCNLMWQGSLNTREFLKLKDSIIQHIETHAEECLKKYREKDTH